MLSTCATRERGESTAGARSLSLKSTQHRPSINADGAHAPVRQGTDHHDGVHYDNDEQDGSIWINPCCGLMPSKRVGNHTPQGDGQGTHRTNNTDEHGHCLADLFGWNGLDEDCLECGLSTPWLVAKLKPTTTAIRAESVTEMTARRKLTARLLSARSLKNLMRPDSHGAVR